MANDVNINVSAAGVKEVSAAFADLSRKLAEVAKSAESASNESKDLGSTITGSVVKGNIAVQLLQEGFRVLATRVKEATTGMIDWADSIDRSTIALGLSFQQAELLDAALSMQGKSLSVLDSAMASLTDKINRAREGSEKFSRAFADLGIDPFKLKNTAQAFETLLEKLNAMPDGAKKTNAAFAIFGRTLGVTVLKMLKDMDDANEMFAKFGRTTEEGRDKLLAADQAMDKLTLASRIASRDLAVLLAPAVKSVADWLIRAREDGGLFVTTIDTIAGAARVAAGGFYFLKLQIQGFVDAIAVLYTGANVVSATANPFAGLTESGRQGIRDAISAFNLAKDEWKKNATTNIDDMVDTWNKGMQNFANAGRRQAYEAGKKTFAGLREGLGDGADEFGGAKMDKDPLKQFRTYLDSLQRQAEAINLGSLAGQFIELGNKVREFREEQAKQGKVLSAADERALANYVAASMEALRNLDRLKRQINDPIKGFTDYVDGLQKQVDGFTLSPMENMVNDMNKKLEDMRAQNAKQNIILSTPEMDRLQENVNRAKALMTQLADHKLKEAMRAQNESFYDRFNEYVGSERVNELLEQERARLRALASAWNDAADPQRAYFRGTQEVIRAMQESGLTEEAARLRMRELTKEYVEAQNKLSGMADLNREIGSTLSGWVESARTQWKSWGDAAKQALNDVARLISRVFVQKPLEKAFESSSGGFSSFLANLFGSTAGAAVAHDGSFNTTRMVSPFMFAGAPRFHNGLAPDEFPAILQRGEQVTSAADVRAQRRGAGGGDSMQVVVNNNFSLGVAQTVRAEVMSMLPTIQRSTTAAVGDARRRGRM